MSEGFVTARQPVHEKGTKRIGHVQGILTQLLRIGKILVHGLQIIFASALLTFLIYWICG